MTAMTLAQANEWLAGTPAEYLAQAIGWYWQCGHEPGYLKSVEVELIGMGMPQWRAESMVEAMTVLARANSD